MGYKAPWWRVAVAYVGLMLVLDRVLADPHTGAITRVLLPLTVGFNILLAAESRPVTLLVLVHRRQPPLTIGLRSDVGSNLFFPNSWHIDHISAIPFCNPRRTTWEKRDPTPETGEYR